MTPEAKAREKIDTKLAKAGWVIQDMCQINPKASLGVAVREYPTSTGPVDYQIRFAYEATGMLTRFTDYNDKKYRSREVFSLES